MVPVFRAGAALLAGILMALLAGQDTSSARLPDPADLAARAETTRATIVRTRLRERRLALSINSFQRRITKLGARGAVLERRLQTLRTRYAARAAALATTRRTLRRQRRRTARLRSRLGQVRDLLAVRLVAEYKADPPDLVSVVIGSDGFAGLLERREFLRRLQRSDQELIREVRRAQTEAGTAIAALKPLQDRQQTAARRVRQQAETVQAARNDVALIELQIAAARDTRRRSLALAKVSRRRQERHLVALQREQRRVRAILAKSARQAPASAPAAPTTTAGGALQMPVSGPLTSPFGPRWGRLHAGIDIAAPGGTPIRAAEAGRVATAGWMGGYGLYTCIQHTASKATCYAHQSRLGTRTGATVRRGEIMGYVGNTGNSFGDHLHFEVRINGQPVNPLAYL